MSRNAFIHGHNSFIHAHNARGGGVPPPPGETGILAVDVASGSVLWVKRNRYYLGCDFLNAAYISDVSDPDHIYTVHPNGIEEHLSIGPIGGVGLIPYYGAFTGLWAVMGTGYYILPGGDGAWQPTTGSPSLFLEDGKAVSFSGFTGPTPQQSFLSVIVEELSGAHFVTTNKTHVGIYPAPAPVPPAANYNTPIYYPVYGTTADKRYVKIFNRIDGTILGTVPLPAGLTDWGDISVEHFAPGRFWAAGRRWNLDGSIALDLSNHVWDLSIPGGPPGSSEYEFILAVLGIYPDTEDNLWAHTYAHRSSQPHQRILKLDTQGQVLWHVGEISLAAALNQSNSTITPYYQYSGYNGEGSIYSLHRRRAGWVVPSNSQGMALWADNVGGLFTEARRFADFNQDRREIHHLRAADGFVDWVLRLPPGLTAPDHVYGSIYLLDISKDRNTLYCGFDSWPGEIPGNLRGPWI